MKCVVLIPILEPERTILLAEKGGLSENDYSGHTVVAEKNFQFIGTMNPGGDFGKKELSPALRNRFTEIWADNSVNKFECYLEIICHNVKVPQHIRNDLSEIMTSFLKWFNEKEFGKRVTISTRDVLSWVNFINQSDLEWFESCLHGASLVFLDGIGGGQSLNFHKKVQTQCLEFLLSRIRQLIPGVTTDLNDIINNSGVIVEKKKRVGIHPFYIKKGMV